MQFVCLVEVWKDTWRIEDKFGRALTSEFRHEQEWRAIEWAKAWITSFQEPIIIHVSSRVERE